MGRTPCCDKDKVKKGAWSVEEDKILVDYIQKHGLGSWRSLPKNAGPFPSSFHCFFFQILYVYSIKNLKKKKDIFQKKML